MEDSLPLNLCHGQKLQDFINRLQTLLHSTSLAFLFYYRASFFFLHETTIPFFPFLLIFFSEAILSFILLLGIGFRLRPAVRTAFPERLPDNEDELPPLDAFICTTDPIKEPTEQFMNTVLSAMTLDHPPQKLHVYVSDDGRSPVTLGGLRASWRFARWWLPFCRRYRLKSCCPKLYFSEMDDDDDDEDIEFIAEKQMIKVFKAEIMRVRTEGDGSVSGISQDHPSMIELRVSGVMSNAPYFLVLDCDMMCNDPTSAKQAMCFHLDPNISPSILLLFSSLKHFVVLIKGMDGLEGPLLCGTCFYATRAALLGNYSTFKDNIDLVQLQQQFGSSNEFIKSLYKKYTPYLVYGTTHALLQQDIKLLASCDYETSSKWGQEVGFLYASVSEDVVTGFFMNCNGWRSVFYDPPKAQFIGSATTNLNDLLIQGTRWNSGLIEIALSKFCPLIYGPFNMSLLQRFCCAEMTLFPLY